MRLQDVFYAESLERNIISYGMLEVKGFCIAYHGKHHVISTLNGGPALLDVGLSNHVMVVREQSCTRTKSPVDLIMVVMAENEADIGQDVHWGLLMHFQRMLVHLNYDTIIKMAGEPSSGIALTDELRANCVACNQAKQKKIVSHRKTQETHHPST